MRKKKNKKIVLVFLVIVLIFTLFYIFINDNVKNNFLISNLNDMSANILKVTSLSINKDTNYNKDLKKEINNDYQKEIIKLKDALKLNKLNSDKSLINASVIKRNTSYWYNNITIDKGKKDNLKVGYAVINNDGLIGKIINVNKYTSDVKLLISLNSDNYISAKFSYDNNDYYGLIDKYDIKNNELTLTNVIGDFNKDNIKNINVVTSGLSDSFSSGLLIGKIKDIKKETFGISNAIIIKPTVNFDDLDIVSVVIKK